VPLERLKRDASAPGRVPPPAFDQHREEVLHDWLG
jgi:hypothetical protein